MPRGGLVGAAFDAPWHLAAASLMFFASFFEREKDYQKRQYLRSLEKVPTFDALFLGDHSQMMFAMGSTEGYYPKTEEVFSTDENKIQNIADII